MSYSDAMIAELKAVPVWNYDTATAWATKHGQKPRSVVAKIGALGLTYQAKSVKNTTAVSTPRVAKADLVKYLENALIMRIPSLEKMSMADLTNLLAKVKELANV